MSIASQLFACTRRPRGSPSVVASSSLPRPPPIINPNNRHHQNHHLNRSHNDVDLDDPQPPHPHNHDPDQTYPIRSRRRQICRRRRRRLPPLDGSDSRSCTVPHRSEYEFDATSTAGIADFSTSDGNQATPTNNRNYDLRFDGSDRLPGPVLQARERLVERLRGVSSTGTRQSRLVSDVSRSTFPTNRPVEGADPDDWDPDYELWLHEQGLLHRRSAIQLEQSWSHRGTRQKRPSLSSGKISNLKREIFTHNKRKDDVLHVSPDCSICLEMFLEGDCLIQLRCSHSFHTNCLVPWLRNCGDCPNCRAPV